MMNENYMAMTEGLKTFLERLELTQYYDKFIIKGFDQETDLCYMNSEDLDSMLITDERHRKMIIAAGTVPPMFMFIILWSPYCHQ